MKASLKFREDQPPISRAKIPITALGLPFLVGAAVGELRELRFDLITAFEFGPSFLVSYRPKDPASPFSVSIKTGIGAFGSPIGAPMSMTTEFNLLASRGGSPGFSVVFKPRLGDFCFKRSASSPSSKPLRKAINVADHEIDGLEMFTVSGEKPNGFAIDFPPAPRGIGGLLSGVEIMARSILPLGSRAAMRFQWGVRVPPELQSSFSIDKIFVPRSPMLVLRKICVQHMPVTATRSTDDEVADNCEHMRLELAALQAENGALRKAVEDLRQRFSGSGSSNGVGKMSPEVGNNSVRTAVAMEQSKRERWSELRSTPEDVNEELKKALISATSGGN